MKRQVFKYLSQCSTQPNDVDRLIVSSFLLVNNIAVKKNEFLKQYVIDKGKSKEYARLLGIVAVIEKELVKYGTEELIELFEFVVSPADRIVNGAIYTPLNIREYIIKQTFATKTNSIKTIKVADISCGCGGFIFNAAKEIKRITKKTYFDIYKNQIYGLDIQSYSITRAKLLLSLLAVSEGEDKDEFQFNLYVGDALDFNWCKKVKKYSGFDIILGNPPYVCSRHLNDETINKLNKWSVCKSGHPDLYIPFFQIGIENLSDNGVLGYITMNSYFKSINGRGIREYLQNNSLGLRIIDFGTEQIFKSKYTYTCICFIEKKKNRYIQYIKSEKSKQLPTIIKAFNKIKYSTLDSRKGWNLQENENISKIESTGVPFGELYKTRNGIATLKNEIFIFKPIDEDKDYYYLQNGSIFQIEKEICRDIINPNKLNNTNSISHLKEKVIFPYDNSKNPKLLSESYIKKNYPKAYKYLVDKKNILESRDKGKGEYKNWFAFGRSQSLKKMKHKLFMPHISNKTPNYVICSDDNLLFYNGLAIVEQTIGKLTFIKKLLESRLFWYYIKNTSKPYTSGYFSLSSNYIKYFGVCDLSKQELEYVNNVHDRNILDKYFEQKYGIEILS